MKKPKIQFKGVAGKVVETIKFKQEQGELWLEINFRDKTTMYFELCPTVRLEPELWSWKTDEPRTIRRYPVITG